MNLQQKEWFKRAGLTEEKKRAVKSTKRKNDWKIKWKTGGTETNFTVSSKKSITVTKSGKSSIIINGDIVVDLDLGNIELL